MGRGLPRYDPQRRTKPIDRHGNAGTVFVTMGGVFRDWPCVHKAIFQNARCDGLERKTIDGPVNITHNTTSGEVVVLGKTEGV